MTDRQILLQQLVDYLETTPDLPEYLAQEPASSATFDPYQFVSEWIALRQEMKQQGKLLQSAQEQLQRELEAARSHNTQLQQQLTATTVAQEQRQNKDQERLLSTLLNIMDALDRACAHWQEQAESTPSLPTSGGWRTSLAQWLADLSQSIAPPSNPEPNWAEVLQSDRQGIELIRQNLLELLQQQKVTPIQALGQSFDSRCMYALGRQPSESPAGTVIQEVVRGYEWGDRILREAQVIVSAGTTA